MTEAANGEPALRVENLTVASPANGRVLLSDVSFELQAGQALAENVNGAGFEKMASMATELHERTGNDELLAAFLTPEAGLPATCRRMVDAANQAGGEDNITVVLLKFEE